MSSSSIIVRPLASPGEYELHFQFADQAFSPDPSSASATFWQQVITSRPEFRSEQLRGAFRDGEQIGSYHIEERMLRMGKAALATGCIGSVVTYPAHRNQRVATVLMDDAIRFAHAHRHALLLLDGIPKFYHRFGYIDMFDQAIHEIDRTAVLAQAPGTHTVRAANQDDVTDILGLYERHYGPYVGSFLRTEKQQVHRLQYRSSENPVWLAVHANGSTEGYLSIPRANERSQALELAAESWDAALALLQHHARLLDGPDAPLFLRYRLPHSAPVLQWMIDHLEVVDTSHWKHPSDEWVIRSQSFHHKDAGWMARLVDLSTFTQAILPEWQERWQRSLSQWSGKVHLQVGDESCFVQIEGSQLRLVDQAMGTAEAVQLTPQDFIQVAFGYRTVAQAINHSGQTISNEMLAVLKVLFPECQTWIPASDWF